MLDGELVDVAVALGGAVKYVEVTTNVTGGSGAELLEDEIEDFAEDDRDRLDGAGTGLVVIKLVDIMVELESRADRIEEVELASALDEVGGRLQGESGGSLLPWLTDERESRWKNGDVAWSTFASFIGQADKDSNGPPGNKEVKEAVSEEERRRRQGYVMAGRSKREGEL
ncbi:MAG: hypothetical protein M1824_004910 [Vezdaea acicularis]|nr:MAG: hypothetical protein M1824_004910 [Vezdaea acicularis]